MTMKRSVFHGKCNKSGSEPTWQSIKHRSLAPQPSQMTFFALFLLKSHPLLKGFQPLVKMNIGSYKNSGTLLHRCVIISLLFPSV